VLALARTQLAAHGQTSLAATDDDRVEPLYHLGRSAQWVIQKCLAKLQARIC
jgi:hypothetical protein